MPLVTRVRSVRIDLSRKIQRRIVEDVAIEAPLTIKVNSRSFVTLMASPFEQKELALGHLIGEGIVKTLDEVESVDVTEGQVDVKVLGDVYERLELSSKVRVVTTACGSVEDFYRVLDSIEKPFVKSDYKVSPEKIAHMAQELNARSLRDGNEIGVHAAILFCEDKIAAYTEDVGRHNSVDKVIGIAALKNINFDRCVMLTTGRQASDMIIKAARAGIPIAITIRGPLYSGVFAAWRTGVTAVAFVRGPRMTVYTYPERILSAGLKVETTAQNSAS